CEDGAFITDIGPFNPEFEERKPAADIDLLFFGAATKKDLARLASLRKAILKNGAVWVVYPKGRQEIREIDVIKAGKAAGLTDNKVCSFAPTHTALRFVIPLAKRSPTTRFAASPQRTPLFASLSRSRTANRVRLFASTRTACRRFRMGSRTLIA